MSYRTEDDDFALIGLATPALVRLLDRRIEQALSSLRGEYHTSPHDLRPAVAHYVALHMLRQDLITKLDERAESTEKP